MRVLYVSAHGDDVPIGCGGTILKRRKEDEAYYAEFTLCTKHSGHDHVLTEEEVTEEVLQALKLLGIKTDHAYIWNFENTRLWKFADEIREKLEELGRQIKPERIYVHTVNDRHQDHQTVAWSTLRAFRGKEIRCYEVNSNTPGGFKPNLYIDVSKFLEEKTKVLNCYHTELKKPYFIRKSWIDMAKFRGIACRVDAAEAFELVWRME